MGASKYQTTGEVARFGLVGIINTLVDYVVFITLTIVFRLPLSRVWLAKYPSSVVAMIVSFILNRRFVFRSQQRDVWGQALRFVSTTLVGVFVIQNLLTQYLAGHQQYFGRTAFDVLGAIGLANLHFSFHDRTLGLTESFTIKTVAFGMATLASLTWNFLTYKYWAFRVDDEGEEQ
jgi:putative flippase GtrA